MNRENKLIYLLNPVTFVVVGLVLMISIVVFHAQINRVGIIDSFYKVSQSTASKPAPKEVLGEIVTNENNLSARALEFQQAGPSIKLLYQMSPDFFITQN